MSVVKPNDPRLTDALSAVDKGDFYLYCRDNKIIEDTMINALLLKYPKLAEHIIRKIVIETDPEFADDVHVGNYAQKTMILDILLTKSGIDEVMIANKKIESRKHILLYGDAGVGKTSFITRMKRWFAMTQINASDTRTLTEMLKTISGAGKMMSLSGDPPLLVFDEMDNLSKTGTNYLIDLIGPSLKECQQAIIGIDQEKKTLTNAAKTFIGKLSKRSRVPIVMICNFIDRVDIRIRSNDRVTLIKFDHPEKYELQSLMELYSLKYFDSPEPEFDVALAPTTDQIKQFIVDSRGDVRTAKHMLVGGESFDIVEVHKPMEFTYLVFTMDDRDELYEMLCDETYLSPTTLMFYIANNLLTYYDNVSQIRDSFDILTKAEALKFKTDTDYVWGLIAFGIPVSPLKGLRPQYPRVKLKQDEEEKETNKTETETDSDDE